MVPAADTRLLHRSTRSLALTEAGRRFYEQSSAAVEAAQAAYDGADELRKELAGTVRVSAPLVLAESYIAPILPGYMASYPKVAVYIEATDRTVSLIEERFDIARRAARQIEEAAGQCRESRIRVRLFGQGFDTTCLRG